MKYRNVGNSGLKISEISLGAWLTYGGALDLVRSHECITKAIELGVNFIDNADVYARGQAETIVGKIIREENYNRKDLVLSSKVFWPMTNNINDRGLSRKHIMESIEGTLKRLELEYLDIYFCHRYDPYTPLEEVVQAMTNLVDRGLIHYWGTSVWPAIQLERAVWIARDIGGHPPIVEQPQYNMISRYIELEVIETCKRNGMGITCFSPLSQGILTGKYNEGVPAGSRGATTDWLRWDLTTENVEKVKKLVPIAESLEITLSQLALAWILRHEVISCAITGATKPEHVETNIAASSVQLSNEVLKEIEEILQNKPELPGIYQPPW